MPLEDTDPGGARHAVGMLRDSLDWLKAEVYATVIAPGVLDRGAVGSCLKVLETAQCTGREAVAGLAGSPGR